MLLQEYDIESAQDIQDALKDLLGGTIKEMMEAEKDDHLGYSKSERSDSDDYRNGYKTKQVNSSYGSMEIQVPQDRKSTFEPQVVKKRQKDISDIVQKIISMYAKGMTTRQISETLEDILWFWSIWGLYFQCDRHFDRIKVLIHESNGYVLLYKNWMLCKENICRQGTNPRSDLSHSNSSTGWWQGWESSSQRPFGQPRTLDFTGFSALFVV